MQPAKTSDLTKAPHVNADNSITREEHVTAADPQVDPTRHRELVSRATSLWSSGDVVPDARMLIEDHPSLRANRALLIELAYEEYCARREQGESLAIADYCQRFPSIARSLYRQLEVDEFFRCHPSAVGMESPPEWPRRGDQLLRFTVVDEIGRGAFARAYLCSQGGVGNRQVVVKVSRGGTFEADTMGSLDHPNVMPIYSVDRDEATELTAICMPFVGRSTLYDVIDVAFGSGKLPTRASAIVEASRGLTKRGDCYHLLPLTHRMRTRAPYVTGVLQLAVQICAALQHAHERGIVHGDLKPSNIVMSIAGVPLLVDFNLAQNRGTETLLAGGTLPYMAPEQIRTMLLGVDASDKVDHRADIFALGAILFELLTGEPPFGESERDAELVGMAGRLLDRQQAGPTPLRSLNPLVGASVAEIVVACLAYDPVRRPVSATEVEQRLRRELAVSPRIRRAVVHHRRAALATLAVTLVATAGGSTWLATRPSLRDRRFQAGVAAYHEHDYQAAVDLLNQAIQQDETFAPAYLARACAEIRAYEQDHFRGWLDSAFHSITLASRFHDHPDIIAVRAYCLLLKGESEIAINEYLKLIEKGVVSADVHNNLAYCLERSTTALAREGRYDRIAATHAEALLHAETAARLDPELWQAHWNVMFIDLRKVSPGPTAPHVPRRGLIAAREAIRLNPDDPSTCFFGAKVAGLVAIEDDDAQLWDECAEYYARAAELGHKFDLSVVAAGHPLFYVRNHPRLSAAIANSRSVKLRQSRSHYVMPPAFFAAFSLESK